MSLLSNPFQENLMPFQDTLHIFQVSLDAAFTLCCIFRNLIVSITGFRLSVIQLHPQLVAFLFLLLEKLEMKILKFNPILLATLLLPVPQEVDVFIQSILLLTLADLVNK